MTTSDNRVSERCFCGADLSNMIIKDGGTRICTNAAAHKVVPCMDGRACHAGTVYVPGFEAMAVIRDKGARVSAFYTCDACVDASCDRETRRTAIDALFELDQNCDLCGQRGTQHDGMMHPHFTYVKRRR